jgi:hypothetical protein
MMNAFKYYKFDETRPAIIPLTNKIEDRRQAQQDIVVFKCVHKHAQVLSNSWCTIGNQ